MTSNHSFDGDITTEKEFKSALGRLLYLSVQNGVDPRGSWVSRNSDGVPDWEAIVVELADDSGVD